MNREAVIAAFKQGLPGVLTLFMQLTDQITQLQKTIAEQVEKIKQLEHHLNRNSQNSHMPPSSDGMRKPKPNQQNRRHSSGKKPGGQVGHKGSNLPLSDHPDRIISIRSKRCTKCHRDLDDCKPIQQERRQSSDLPEEIRLQVTEIRGDTLLCPDCDTINKPEFPAGFDQPTQYGPRVKAWAVYLRQRQLLPYDRIAEIFADGFNQPISTGTLVNFNNTCAEKLESVQEDIRLRLLASPCNGFDETQVRVGKTRQWLHVACNEDYTLYLIHPKRGREAIEKMNVLPGYKGYAIHDRWKPYFEYDDCQHGACHSHLARDLVGIVEQTGQTWTTELKELFLAMNKARMAEIKVGHYEFSAEQLKKFEADYDKLVQEGRQLNTVADEQKQTTASGMGECKNTDGLHVRFVFVRKHESGKKKHTAAQNLLTWFVEKRDYVLSFIYDFAVWYTNNQSERDLRMSKVQQKISGCFRSEGGTLTLANNWSYLSTARKHGLSPLQAIYRVFTAGEERPSLLTLLPELALTNAAHELNSPAPPQITCPAICEQDLVGGLIGCHVASLSISTASVAPRAP